MSETKQDDDTFHPWHVAGFTQCGSERYKKNSDVNSDSDDSFKILYEQDAKDESDEFKRIYGSDEEPVKSGQDIDDDEFHPFKTGITYFDDKMAGKNITVTSDHANQIISDDNVKRLDSVHADGNPVEYDHMEEGIATGSEVRDKQEEPLEDVYRRSFEQGEAKGYEEGLARGFEEGFAKGMEEGYKSGEEKGEQEGYDAGFQKGEEDGRVVSDAKALEIISSLEDIFQKAEQSWKNTVKNHESKLLSLICRIAEKVVLAKVELDESIVKDSVLNALATMPEPEDISLHISPDDYEYIEMIKDDFFEHIKSLKSVSVISNPSVTRGGCKIESSKAKVETDIQTRLEQVFSSVMGARLS